MADIQKTIKNCLLTSGGFTAGAKKNTPPEYSGRRHQYYGSATDKFYAQYSKYSSDYMDAELEQWDENGKPYWEAVTVRFANIVTDTASITRNFDDYKNVLFDQRKIDYIRPGVKLRCGGSTWLAINPDNISSVNANSIFRRCNAVWNHLDYYGNVISEPIIVENARANASSPDTQTDQQIATGYFNVYCQYNDFTRQINDNTRIILGDAGNPTENAKAYRVTGFANFFREFTDENTSVRTLTFTIRVQTKNEETDDLINCVANGKAFSWEMQISGVSFVPVGATAQFSAASVRNGKAVESTEEHPISYAWASSNPTVASINSAGILTAHRSGRSFITATLMQNPSVTATFTVYVRAAANDEIRIVSAVPPYVGMLDTITVEARLYRNGTEQSTPITWTLSGADAQAYAYQTESDYAISVTCYGYSETPLTITAEAGGLSRSVTVGLDGM